MNIYIYIYTYTHIYRNKHRLDIDVYVRYAIVAIFRQAAGNPKRLSKEAWS